MGLTTNLHGIWEYLYQQAACRVGRHDWSVIWTGSTATSFACTFCRCSKVEPTPERNS